MVSSIDTAAVRSWLDAIPGGQLGAEADRQWQRFASIGVPVVTVYGSYDTGKSALLRRLIVDSGAVVPEWLTISARHETFEVNEVEAAGCLLRDTPGFVAGATDARADMNTQLANAAVDLTDVAVVAVTPQLATAELPALQSLVHRGWAPRSLWFVISRFDEAGVDPEFNPGGYRELAERKTHELRRALGLDDSVPVFVVSQDFAQMAGSERNPDPALWDESREWDGISALRAALDAVGSGDVSSLRDAAAERFWRQEVTIAVDALRAEVVKYLDHEHFSDEGRRLRESWLAQLDALDQSAEADLRGRISETVGQAVDDERDAASFQRALKSTVDVWYGLQERTVEKLLRSVDDTIALERQRPSWQKLEELAESVRGQTTPKPVQKERPEVITPSVKRVSEASLTALREYEKFSALKQPSGSPAVSALGASRKVAVATAVMPVVTELASIAERFYRDRANAQDADRQRRSLAAELDRVGEHTASIALQEFEPIMDAARQAIIEATAERIALREGLQRLVAELRALVASGEDLLGIANPDKK